MLNRCLLIALTGGSYYFFSRLYVKLYSSFLDRMKRAAPRRQVRLGHRAATHLCATISAAAAAWLVRLEQSHPILESPARVLQRVLVSRWGSSSGSGSGSCSGSG